MLFTIVCCVFSCLCRFPVVHAVITLGCQLHRLSVLGVRKPLSSRPLGLKCWWWFSSQNDSEWLQKLGYLGLHCYICKISTLCEFKGTVILHPPHLPALRDRSWLNSLILSVCISEGCCPSYQSLSSSCDRRTVTASSEKSDDRKRTQTTQKIALLSYWH